MDSCEVCGCPTFGGCLLCPHCYYRGQRIADNVAPTETNETAV